MARVGSIIEKYSPELEKIRASDKINIIFVNYKVKQHNSRLVPRSGRRVGNDVYVDIIKIPTSVRVKFKEDNTFKEVQLNDFNFFKYINGELTKQEYIEQADLQTESVGCFTFILLILLILCTILAD